MAYTTIDDPSAHFQAVLWAGNGSNPRNITNTGNSDLKGDWIWTKNRTDAGTNNVTCNSTIGFDAPTGQGLSGGPYGGQLSTDSSGLASTPAATYGYVSAHLTNGFTVAAGGTNGDTCNASGKDFVGFQWKAAGGTTSSNTDGNITTTLQTNSTAGFTIGTYTGAGSSPDNKTIGHGLGAIPDLVLIKGRDGSGLGGAAQYWIVGAPNTEVFGNGGNKHMFLDTTNALMDNSTIWRSANFTSTTIPLGGHAALNGSGASYIFYAFKNIQGYSKFGTYIGNGNSDGPFIYTGFKPAFVIAKNTDATTSWRMNGPDGVFLSADSTDAVYDSAPGPIDRVSNGFKIRGGDDLRASGGNFIYAAWATNPFVTSTGVPTTAGSTGPAT